MKKHKPTASVSVHDLEEQALSQLTATKYKEAIKLYKELLQTADNEQWHQKLAYCYIQRAKDFAAKGMYKEALVLWENHVQHAQPPYDAYDQYIIWLFETNNLPSIKASLSQLSAQQLDKQYPELAAVLGLLMLGKYSEFQQDLPQDSSVIAHFNIVQTALQAYQNNQTDKLRETLKKLPYRSAFRDLRTLLNASLVMSDSLIKAQALLVKIPVNSPYYQAARVMLACTREGAELAEALRLLDYQQRSIVAEIKKLNKKQQDFIQHYSRLHDNLSDKVQFNLATQYKSLIGTEVARQFCQTTLTHYPAGNKAFNQHFGEASEFEENRINALNCEREENLYDAEYYWRGCLGHLNKGDPVDNLKAALILRRIATWEPEAEDRINVLIESLDYDANDHESYLAITQHFSQKPENAKAYKLWLTKILDQFPQDIEALTLAVKAATANKSFKKACQYADKILKTDPLNTFAKQTLFSSHMAHAQQLMRDKSYHLVEKEIKHAEKINLIKANQKQLQLMRALLFFANEDKQQGLQSITQELDALHTNPVSRHFHATMEALLNGLPVTTILRELAPAKDYLLSENELRAFIQQLTPYTTNDEEQAFLHKALEKVKAPLKKSLSEQGYPEELLLNFCKVLDSIQHFELLRHIAKPALIKWKNPIWTYYQIYANNNAEAANCSADEVRRLKLAHKVAVENKDHPTIILFEKLLDSYFDANPQQGLSFLDDLFAGFVDEDDEDHDPMEELFGHLEQGVMIKLNEKAESIMKKTTPDRLIQGLMKNQGNQEAVLMAMMQSPDILSALMLLKAADELKIDIEVDLNDVINTFGILTDDKPFPFPF
ncbi:MAG: hypothetical protein KAJ63_06085 [Methyloprofundus sp.]|nr:hypothetical protein [Methyloprofundus sp.]